MSYRPPAGPRVHDAHVQSRPGWRDKERGMNRSRDWSLPRNRNREVRDAGRMIFTPGQGGFDGCEGRFDEVDTRNR